MDGQSLGQQAPPYTVRAAYFWSVGEKRLTEEIKIIDFSEAFLNSQDERTKLHTPLSFRAPESFFGEPIGPPADIWAFGCTVFDIFGNGNLFNGFMSSKDSILVEMIGLLGTLPSQWWERWESKIYYFTNENAPKIENVIYDIDQPKPLALRIQEMRPDKDQSFDSEKLLSNLQNLLEAVLKYLPSERLTAEQVSKLRWIQDQLLLRDSVRPPAYTGNIGS